MITENETYYEIDPFFQSDLEIEVNELLSSSKYNNKPIEIVKMRFGLGEYDIPYTWDDIASELDLTPMRCKQAFSNVIRDLKIKNLN